MVSSSPEKTEIIDGRIMFGTVMVPGLGFWRSLTIRHFCLVFEMNIGKMDMR
jgi:hypothetical protein